jgi:hemolysin activation/secretion protein
LAGVRLAIRAAIMGFLLAAVQPAVAQAVRSPQPNLGSTEKRFDAFEAEERRAKRAVPLPRAAIASASADTKPLFRLTGVVVPASAPLSAEVVAAAYRPYLGKTVSQADLAAMATAISERYRNAGYHLTRAIVPPQDIKDGRVRIQVIEGRIADIVVKGSRAAQFGVRKILAPLTVESPSRGATVERQLLLVNDLPGIRITDTAIEEIGTGTGRFRLTMYVETWRNYTVLGIDNRGTTAVGPLESYLASSFNSYLVGGDTLGINVSTVPDTPQELAFGRVFYNAPVGIDGARIGAIASYGNVRPGDDRAAINTRDLAQTYELRGSIIPIRTREASLWLTGAFAVGDYAEDTVFGPNYRDHIRTVSLTVDYQARDRLNGWNYWTVTARQGLDIFSASNRGDAFLSRDDGSGTFSKLNVFYTRYQPLSDVWSMKMSFAGQLVSSPLLAAEEFYLGSAFGRGYFGDEVSGDNGVGGSLELRFDQKLDLSFLKGYQLYTYGDRTVAWNFHSRGEELSLSLVGVGVRLYLPADFQAGVELAKPVEYHASFAQPLDPRAFFYVSKVFKLCPGSAQMHCS